MSPIFWVTQYHIWSSRCHLHNTIYAAADATYTTPYMQQQMPLTQYHICSSRCHLHNTIYAAADATYAIPYMEQQMPLTQYHIWSSRCHLHNTIYAAADATYTIPYMQQQMPMWGCLGPGWTDRQTEKSWITYKIKHKLHHGKEGSRNKLTIWEKTMYECNRPKKAILVIDCKNTFAG